MRNYRRDAENAGFDGIIEKEGRMEITCRLILKQQHMISNARRVDQVEGSTKSFTERKSEGTIFT